MTDKRGLHRLASDERGMIVGWLGKLAIGFILVAVVVFDGGSIVINFFTLDSTASEIAVKVTADVGSTTLRETTLTDQAEVLAKESGARLVDLRLEGNVVHVTLRRRAETLIVGRIPWIADWARATAEGQAGTG